MKIYILQISAKQKCHDSIIFTHWDHNVFVVGELSFYTCVVGDNSICVEVLCEFFLGQSFEAFSMARVIIIRLICVFCKNLYFS